MKPSLMLRSRPARGFGMIELMIALVLGVVVLGGALSLFASNRQAFRATEGLSRLQENARIGFEMMTRDVRDAGGTPCSKNLPIADVLTGAGSLWWDNWNNGMRGFDGAQDISGIARGAAIGQRADGTDAIEIHSGGTGGTSVISHNAPSAIIDVLDNTQFAVGDIALMCDYRQAAIFQITQLPSGGKVQHRTGGTLNCSKNLGFPVDCSSVKTGPVFPPNSILVKLNSVRWFIGNNPRGGLSLYRQFGSAAPDEIAEGVTDLQLTYLLPGKAAYAPATDTDVAAGWKDVNAVRIAFTAASTENVGTGFVPLTRTVVEIAALRNRNE